MYFIDHPSPPPPLPILFLFIFMYKNSFGLLVFGSSELYFDQCYQIAVMIVPWQYGMVVQQDMCYDMADSHGFINSQTVMAEKAQKSSKERDVSLCPQLIITYFHGHTQGP